MLSIIEEALRRGGKVLMQHFGSLQEIQVKENQSNIVTQADLQSEKVMVDFLQNRFPDHNIIAEETGFRNNNSAYTWVIDPLDGTSNFAAGLPWFGILVALLQQHQPVAAGMYLPFYDELYLAEKGQGATRNGAPVSISSEKSLKDVLVAYSLDFTEIPGKTAYEARIIQSLVEAVRNLRSTNSAVDLCYTADGRLGGSINQTTKLWDIAAPALIIEEASGVVTDIEGCPHDFRVDESDYTRNFTIVAANPVLHRALMQLIREAK